MTAVDGERLAAALGAAARWHGAQVRKGTDIPYVSHLLQVAGLVLEHGGSSDLAVAALLHDVVEDTDATIEQVEEAFGPAVAAIVADCTDTRPGDRPDAKSPWAVRKGEWLVRAASMPPDSLLVAACDKRHNVGALVADARAGGVEAISPPRFTGRPDQVVQYHREFVATAGSRLPARLVGELEALIDELDALIKAASGDVGPAAGPAGGTDRPA